MGHTGFAMPLRIPWPALTCWMLAVAPVHATDSGLRRLPSPGSDLWQPIRFRSIDRHTLYERLDPTNSTPDAQGGNDPIAVLRARSECSASGLILRLSGEVDLRSTPKLRWSWRVEEGLDIPDERVRGGDDFAARVYVLFDFDPAQSSLWQRLRRQVAIALYGEGLPGKAISYVWASHAPVGSSWKNPYSADTMMVVLQSRGDLGWRTQTVDLVEDHHRLLGESRASLMGIAVMSDSDDSCQKAAAYFSDFELLP